MPNWKLGRPDTVLEPMLPVKFGMGTPVAAAAKGSHRQDQTTEINNRLNAEVSGSI